MRSKELILGMFLLITTSDALRFLVVFPMVAHSHNTLGRGVCRHLLQARHEVVYITSYPQEKTVSNLTEVSVGHLTAKFVKGRMKKNMNSVQYLVGKGNVVDTANFFYLPFELHKQILEDEVIINFLSDPKQQFDAVIVEWFFSDLFAGLAPLFKCPLIYIGSTEPHWQILRLVDEIPNPAYTSVNLFATSSAPITMWDKMCELLTLVNKYFVTIVKFGLLERNTYNAVYPTIAAKRAVTMPTFDDAIYNVSMILMNAHPSLGLANKLPQNAKLIGGFHIDNNIPTPPSIKKLMDEAKHGVIYFSLGSNVQSSLMSNKMKQSLLKAFSTLKQIVIWKFEAEMEEVPSNVYFIKWAPQQNILSHPNVKMFVTHAGQLSSLEAISNGVPMITVPMYGDQFRNAKTMAAKGFSINILLTEHLAKDILHAVHEILSNPIADGYKVLLVAPFPVRSLSILGGGYTRHLTDAGHEVTFITAFPSKDEYGSKLRQIDVSDNFKGLPSGDENGMEPILKGEIIQFDLQMMQTGAVYNAILTFQNENVKKLFEDPNENFDVVIADFFETEIYSALAVLYDCPMIWSYSMGAHWQVLRLIDAPTNPAYTADYLSTNVLPFGFQQRLEELWAQIKWRWLKYSVTQPMEEEAYKKYFEPLLAKRGKSLPDYNEVIYNASLVFANEHHATGQIPVVPQNFKLIGGYHVETPAKPLPKDLQILMDNSKDGVIYFSMGSNWKSKDLPKSIIKGLIKAFGQLKQTVIWKFEEPLLDTPKNLHIVNWAPQLSILAHPKCLLFITHGGLLSSTEAIHFGVPIIGVPILFDQILNVNRAEAKGYAIKVPLSYNLPEDLKAAIDTMLKDPKFKTTVKELSSIYHDRPIPPGKELVHWVEHVVKTRGAPHLRSPALNVPAYQKMYLDLAAVVLASTLLFLVAVKSMCNSKRRVKKEKIK